MSVSLVARRHGIAPNQLFTWRRLYASGALSAVGAGEEVVAASEYRALQHQVGATTRKCSECATSWTKQKRTARWYVRCTLDGCRSGGGRRHVSDVPDSDTRSRLKCAPTVTPLGFPLPNQIVVQGRKPRARLLELLDAPSRRQRRGARASHAAGSARFRAVLPGLAALFRRGAPCRYHDRGRPHRRACEDHDRSVGVTQGDMRAR